MKKQYFRGLLLAWGVLIFVGCQKANIDDQTEEANPSGISNVRASSAEDGVLLSWLNPDNKPYDQIEISYLEEGSKKSMIVEPEEQNSSIAIPLSDANVYKFHLVALHSAQSHRYDEITIKGRKLSPMDPVDEIQEMLNSVEIYGGSGGIRILWENPQNIVATIRVIYDNQTIALNAAQLVREHTIFGLDLDRSYNFEVTIVFDGLIESQVRTVAAQPSVGFSRLIPDNWSITASSSQTAQPVVNLLDNDPATYWRSNDYVGSGQHVIVNFQKLHNISALSFVRRWGNNENSSWDIKISTSADGVNYTEGYLYRNNHADRPTPNVLLRIEFDRGKEGEQMYPLPIPETAQYVRIDFVRGSAFAVYGDINFYGD